MRELDYQERVLSALGHCLDALKEAKPAAEEIAALSRANPHLKLPVPDVTAEAWKALGEAGRLPPSRANIPFSPRPDGIGRPVPNAVLKVPTGGGKTYLAVQALSRIMSSYLGRSTGLVLWIVPNEAIYSQTKRRFQDRQDPYRQLLDVASGNRVRLLEKDSTLHRRDLELHLCILLLMLQSSNRQNKEALRMFRDRGDVHGVFPSDGNPSAHAEILAATPNLDCYDLGDFRHGSTVKDSLGNALRLIRPVVILDEGHRAISELAFETLYGFNPCFVLDLSATPVDVAARGGKNPKPGRPANILVEVMGRDLSNEHMIKMPLNLDPRGGSDWHSTLAAAVERLRGLEAEAARLHGERGRYIRPILLVQVERTGKDQRDGFTSTPWTPASGWWRRDSTRRRSPSRPPRPTSWPRLRIRTCSPPSTGCG